MKCLLAMLFIGLVLAVLVLSYWLYQMKWFEKSYYQLANKINQEKKDRVLKELADHEAIRQKIDKKFITILRIAFSFKSFWVGLSIRRIWNRSQQPLVGRWIESTNKRKASLMCQISSIWYWRGDVAMKLSGRGLATTIIITLVMGQLCVIGLRNFLDFIFR